MGFGDYLSELSGKTKLAILAMILISVPLFAFYLGMVGTYENPSVKWLSTVLGYLAIPAIIAFLILMGYWTWKQKRGEWD